MKESAKLVFTNEEGQAAELELKKIQVEIEGINLSIKRETIPIYAEGNENPVEFLRSKSTISGTMVLNINSI